MSEEIKIFVNGSHFTWLFRTRYLVPSRIGSLSNRKWRAFCDKTKQRLQKRLQ